MKIESVLQELQYHKSKILGCHSRRNCCARSRCGNATPPGVGFSLPLPVSLNRFWRTVQIQVSFLSIAGLHRRLLLVGYGPALASIR